MYAQTELLRWLNALLVSQCVCRRAYYGGRMSRCGYVYMCVCVCVCVSVCKCIHTVCKKTRKEEVVHSPTTKASRWIVGLNEAASLPWISVWLNKVREKETKKTGNNQAFPVFSKVVGDWSEESWSEESIGVNQTNPSEQVGPRKWLELEMHSESAGIPIAGVIFWIWQRRIRTGRTAGAVQKNGPK